MDIVISNSPEETRQLGVAWGLTVRPGSVVALQGDLGAGKTQLVRGMGEGLESPARVHSPTYALINIYEGGRLTLNHIDLYRLQSPEDMEGAGLHEYIWSPRDVTVVEWADRWLGHPLQPPPSRAMPTGGLRCVWIETLDDNVREIRYEDFGP